MEVPSGLPPRSNVRRRRRKRGEERDSKRMRKPCNREHVTDDESDEGSHCESPKATRDLPLKRNTGLSDGVPVVPSTVAGECSVAQHERQQMIDYKTFGNFEYLDHTADIQIHSWGPTEKEAFADAVVAMFGYMTDLRAINEDPECSATVEVSGHDRDSLLFALMDEFLCLFCTEDVVVRRVQVVEFDRDTWTMKAKGIGEKFDLNRHPQGTEVKAITYSNMQIHVKPEQVDVFVIVDI